MESTPKRVAVASKNLGLFALVDEMHSVPKELWDDSVQFVNSPVETKVIGTTR